MSNAFELEEYYKRRNLRLSNKPLKETCGRTLKRLKLPAPDNYIKYRCYFLREPSPLSFSLADGQIYISSGLLARLENIDELAAVLAHEAHHIAAHHHLSANKSRHIAERSTQVGAAILGAFIPAGNVLPIMANELATQAVTSFDIDEEMEADRQAAQILARTHYDADVLPQALFRAREEAASNTYGLRGVWSSYEQIDRRLAAIEQFLAEQEDDGREAPTQKEFLAEKVATLQPLVVDDYVRHGLPRAGVAFATSVLEKTSTALLLTTRGDAFIALGPFPDLDPTPELAKKQSKAWKRLSRRDIHAQQLATEEGQSFFQSHLAAAANDYTAALSMDENLARAHRGLGVALKHQGQFRQAARHLIRYLKLEPAALDRALVIEELEEIRFALTSQKKEAS
ncbi:MAG: M48 family metalloprotease [Pseudomonadales bacterium]